MNAGFEIIVCTYRQLLGCQRDRLLERNRQTSSPGASSSDLSETGVIHSFRPRRQRFGRVQVVVANSITDEHGINDPRIDIVLPIKFYTGGVCIYHQKAVSRGGYPVRACALGG